jgi:HK97 gp10 family phage protein
MSLGRPGTPSVQNGIQWEGMKEMAERMKGLSREVQDRLAFRATAAAARNVRKSAQDNIQSYGLIDSGALIGNVAFARKQPQGLSFSYDIGVRHGSRKQIKDDDDPYYWFMLEFGTVKRPGTPFLTLAFEQEKDTSLELMRQVLTTGIERELAKK